MDENISQECGVSNDDDYQDTWIVCDNEDTYFVGFSIMRWFWLKAKLTQKVYYSYW